MGLVSFLRSVNFINAREWKPNEWTKMVFIKPLPYHGERLQVDTQKNNRNTWMVSRSIVMVVQSATDRVSQRQQSALKLVYPAIVSDMSLQETLSDKPFESPKQKHKRSPTKLNKNNP